MSRPVAPRPERRPEPRPRWGRIASVSASAAVVLVAVLGGIGIVPTPGPASAATAPRHESAAPTASREQADRGSALVGPTAAAGSGAGAGTSSAPRTARTPRSLGAPAARQDSVDDVLPAGSGEGRRVVFSEARQRVWLVDDRDRVVDTYLVSGSLTDNLQPGTYQVYSRSVDAVGIDDSGTMHWFVRFTQGPTGAAIGFHSIPVKDGHLVQRVDQLGTPQSHGCIRQQASDAKRMWAFAQMGTEVVVTA